MYRILSILLSSIALSYAYPTDQYYYASVPEQQYLYEYQPVYYYSNGESLSRPVFYPQLGMSPQYHKLVYNYITDYAGNHKPTPVRAGMFESKPAEETPGTSEIPVRVAEFEGEGSKPEDEEKVTEPEGVNKEETTEGPEKPGMKDQLLPSDFVLLSSNPNSQFYGNFDAIHAVNMKKMKYKSDPSTLPPIGGVISNYILLRDHPDYQNVFPFGRSAQNSYQDQQVNKRQAHYYFDDGVVISAAEEQPNFQKRDEMNKETSPDNNNNNNNNNNGNKEEEKEEQPAVAQSKPSAIALAGPGGVAQASPVGTALVGPGGLAVSAPSGTAVAGPAGQGAIQIANPDEKLKKTENKTKEESEKKGKEETKEPTPSDIYGF